MDTMDTRSMDTRSMDNTADRIEFLSMATRIGRLVTEKNKAYGNSFEASGEVMKLIYPDGIHPDQYVDVLAVVRVIDKLFRIAARKDAFGESPWMDVGGYGTIMAAHDKREFNERFRDNVEAAEGDVVDLTPPEYDGDAARCRCNASESFSESFTECRMCGGRGAIPDIAPAEAFATYTGDEPCESMECPRCGGAGIDPDRRRI